MAKYPDCKDHPSRPRHAGAGKERKERKTKIGANAVRPSKLLILLSEPPDGVPDDTKFLTSGEISVQQITKLAHGAPGSATMSEALHLPKEAVNQNRARMRNSVTTSINVDENADPPIRNLFLI